MPICINDITKKFTGKENTPKGFGYSASGEENSKLMTGKDGNLWYVTSTEKSNKWCKFNIKKEKDVEKFDFSRLPEDFFKDSYIPIVSSEKINIETGLEEKFGGEIPFFVKGEKWPDDDDKPMNFICQFKDPCKEENILYRLFISLDSTDYYHQLLPIELSKENLDNQEIIKLNSEFSAYKIESWGKNKELKSFEFIAEKMGLKDYTEITYKKIYDSYFNSPLLPSSRIKLHGTPFYCQLPDDEKTDVNFIQITDERFLNYMWGDSGIAHIYPDGTFYYDCY
jgi:uncharacterized protein YwqG